MMMDELIDEIDALADRLREKYGIDEVSVAFMRSTGRYLKLDYYPESKQPPGFGEALDATANE